MKVPSQKIAAFEQRWNLKAGEPFPNLAHNYAAPVIRADGTPAVLKIAPDGDPLTHEIAALQLYDGGGATRLLASDDTAGALLLEHAQPGTPLAEITSSDEAVEIAAAAIKRLWQSNATGSHHFPTVEDWCEELNQCDSPVPEKARERARAIFAELSASADSTNLLHGDLHHFNILRAERSPWLVIDPKGVIGEAAYETGTFLRNHLEIHSCKPDRPIVILAERLNLDPVRVRNYAYVQSILSAVWYGKENAKHREISLALAEQFRT